MTYSSLWAGGVWGDVVQLRGNRVSTSLNSRRVEIHQPGDKGAAPRLLSTALKASRAASKSRGD